LIALAKKIGAFLIWRKPQKPHLGLGLMVAQYLATQQPPGGRPWP